MKRTMMAVAVSILFAAPVFAADATPPPMMPGANFEQHKADMLKRIDQRITCTQEEKACVQAAKGPADLKACRETFKSEVLEQRQNMKK